MKTSTKRVIKRVIAVVLLIFGGFYLVVAAGIIPTKVFFGSYYLDAKILSIIAIILIAIGLFLDDRWRSKIKNAFS